MATILSKRGKWLGVPVILITAAVGTTVFASVASEAVSVEAKLIVGSLSVLAAVLSSLQTFFKYAERSEKHRAFGARFGAIRRELEALHASGKTAEDSKYVSALREKLDGLAEEAPAVSTHIFSRIEQDTLQSGDGR